MNWRITKDSIFESYGNGWDCSNPLPVLLLKRKPVTLFTIPATCLSLQKEFPSPKTATLIAPRWKDSRLIPGTTVAMRIWSRPTPGIFLSENRNTLINNVKVHYAEGMGLLAQLCDNLTLEGFGICLKGDNDPRYFTTQADATHFSGCKGKIISRNGLYEGMMDDAINVHGTYLKVVKQIDNHTLVGRYMHSQSWGFKWGEAGDSVQFVRSKTMEITGRPNRITAIVPFDRKQVAGAANSR